MATMNERHTISILLENAAGALSRFRERARERELAREYAREARIASAKAQASIARQHASAAMHDDRLGPGATGVLQSGLGNLPELFVSIFALRAGLTLRRTLGRRLRRRLR